MSKNLDQNFEYFSILYFIGLTHGISGPPCRIESCSVLNDDHGIVTSGHRRRTDGQQDAEEEDKEDGQATTRHRTRYHGELYCEFFGL